MDLLECVWDVSGKLAVLLRQLQEIRMATSIRTWVKITVQNFFRRLPHIFCSSCKHWFLSAPVAVENRIAQYTQSIIVENTSSKKLCYPNV